MKPDIFYNIIVVEALSKTLVEFEQLLQGNFRDVTAQSADEAMRRERSRREIDGFRQVLPTRPVRAWQFESAPMDESLQAPQDVQRAVSLLNDAAPNEMTVGYFGIDTQRLPRAGAVAFCSDTQSGLIGSLEHNLKNYFRVMQHVFCYDRPGRS